jgi:hypothetical protein
MQQLELRHRKAMGARQFSGVARMVDNGTSQGRRQILKLTGCMLAQPGANWGECALPQEKDFQQLQEVPDPCEGSLKPQINSERWRLSMR